MNELLRQFWVSWGVPLSTPMEKNDIFAIWLLTFICVFIATLVICGILSALDTFAGKWYEFEGKLEARQYEPATRSTQTGFVANGTGAISPVMTSSYTEERFDIFLRLQDKTIQKVYVTQQRYFDLKEGDIVVFWLKKGILSKKWIHRTTERPKRLK